MIRLLKFIHLPYPWFRQNVNNVFLIMLMAKKKLHLHLCK